MSKKNTTFGVDPEPDKDFSSGDSNNIPQSEIPEKENTASAEKTKKYLRGVVTKCCILEYSRKTKSEWRCPRHNTKRGFRKN